MPLVGQAPHYKKEQRNRILSSPGAVGQHCSAVRTHEDALFSGQAQSFTLRPNLVEVFIAMGTLRQAILWGFCNIDIAHSYLFILSKFYLVKSIVFSIAGISRTGPNRPDGRSGMFFQAIP